LLTIKCARCKSKVMQYKKIGQGRVLRCYLPRIKRFFARVEKGQLQCPGCDNIIGKKKTGFFQMNRREFTYSGKKIKK